MEGPLIKLLGLIVCVAQYLCNGLEDDIADRCRDLKSGENSELSRMINASGKMVLLHKLLPKLRAENRKVSQLQMLTLRCCTRCFMNSKRLTNLTKLKILPLKVSL